MELDVAGRNATFAMDSLYDCFSSSSSDRNGPALNPNRHGL